VSYQATASSSSTAASSRNSIMSAI
jgi:hypothetical protein